MKLAEKTKPTRYRDLEYEIPLFLRPKAKDAKTMYYEWLKISYSKPKSYIIPPLRDVAYQEYKAMVETTLPATKQGNQWH